MPRGGGLSAQPANLVRNKVAGAYMALAANLRNGNHGRKGSERRARIGSGAAFGDACRNG